jgi:type VI secretion system protein ImpJ
MTLTISSQKTLWEEGMFLTPQHFQQWDRYYDSLLRERLRTISPIDWGLRELEIAESGLINGKLEVLRCAGIMPNGSFFMAPARDALPAARDFRDAFDPRRAPLGVHLAIPILRGEGVACASPEDDGATPAPFARRTLSVRDEGRPESEREITTAVPNLRIVFDGEPLDDYVSVKIAEIERSASGTYALSGTYVPPCLYASVSPFLVELVRRVSEILASKSSELTWRQRRTGGMAEAARFWLLHTVNSHIPRAFHFRRHPQVHPEDVFLGLSTLAAELCSFAGFEYPSELPVYAHEDLGACFAELDEKLRFLLETVVPTKCVELELEETEKSLFTCSIHDSSLLEDAHFYLSLRADAPEERVLSETPAKVKISSRDRIQELVALALGGAGIKHVPNPPSEIPVQPGHVFFEVEKFGSHWEAISASRSIAIYCPLGFPNLHLELLAVKG